MNYTTAALLVDAPSQGKYLFSESKSRGKEITISKIRLLFYHYPEDFQ